MADKTGGAKGEELRIELLRTIFKFKKLANSGLGMKPIDGGRISASRNSCC